MVRAMGHVEPSASLCLSVLSVKSVVRFTAWIRLSQSYPSPALDLMPNQAGV